MDAASNGPWKNVWRGKLTGLWIAVVREGDKPVATFACDSEGQAHAQADAEIALRLADRQRARVLDRRRA